MTTFNTPQQAPHKRGWFYDLLGYFGRQEHPAAANFDPDALVDADGMEAPEAALALTGDRSKKLSIWEEMDSFGLVSSILDLYAEESTQPDYDKQKRVWIESASKQMEQVGQRCLDNLQIEDRIPAIARRLAKYGDDYRRFVYEAGKGVLGWRSVPVAEMTRVEDQYARLVGFKQQGKKFRKGARDVSWPWDYVHFRLPGKDDSDLYGTSILESMFRPWRQLALAEDAMLMFRLRRTPDRNAIFVNVGSLDPTEAAQWTNNYRKKFRKSEFIDPASSNYRKQFNPLTPLEDVFLPVRQGDDVRVEQLAGSGNVGEVYDIEHYRDAFFGSARVPKAYFGFEGDINAKATLLQQDVRFARTCKRMRSSLILGVRTALDFHYVLSGEPGEASSKLDPTKRENSYVVQMSPISYLDEFERLELIQLRFQIIEAQARLAGDLQLDARVWASYILLNYAKLPEELVLRLLTKVEQSSAPPEADAAALESRLNKEQLGLWRDLPRELREQVLDPKRHQRRLGISQLTESEQVAIARQIHTDPKLRKLIGDIAFFYSEPDLMEMADAQRDLSRIPVVAARGMVSADSEDTHAKQLEEDLKTLREESK